VISDGKLHVKITSPLKDNQLLNGQLNVSLTEDSAVTLSAVSTADVNAVVSYYWSVSKRSSTGVTSVLAAPVGQSVSFTPSGFTCGTTEITIAVIAIADLGQIANDDIHATVYSECDPQ